MTAVVWFVVVNAVALGWSIWFARRDRGRP